MTVDEPRTRAGATLRVLLVDDSQDDAEALIDELHAAGYEVDYARVETEQELREELEHGQWQVVLCDFSLPRFSTLSALNVLHELQLDLPFIVISGAVGEETAIRLMKAGAHDFLLKGNLARLVPAVERELREADVRAESAALREQLLLSDRLVQVGTLAAGVAHEINNPLAYVMGNIEYALRELSSPVWTRNVPVSVMEALSSALEGSQRIRATAEDLRIFSRTGDRKPHPVELKRVLESAIGMAGTQIRYRARLVKDFEDVPPIAANENRLGQVFLNLLINAAQSIPEGHSSEHEIRVTLRRVQDHVEVEISDTGSGIPAEVRKRLFQPFVTTKPKEEGTGLGLSICRRIVLEYRGEISARANSDRGTTFQVLLPVVPIERAAATTSRSSRVMIHHGRVLVIDDEPEIVDMIHRELCIEHEVVGMTSAHAALALLDDDAEFDVILCDLMLPSMNGMQLYAELERSQPALLRRIVFMTGGAFTSAARQFLASIPNLSVTKPFEADALTKAVRLTLLRNAPEARPLGAAS
jgi:signal transduction histidine kinase